MCVCISLYLHIQRMEMRDSHDGYFICNESSNSSPQKHTNNTRKKKSNESERASGRWTEAETAAQERMKER